MDIGSSGLGHGNASSMRSTNDHFMTSGRRFSGRMGPTVRVQRTFSNLDASHELNEWERIGQTQLPVPAQKQKGKKRILHSTMMRLSTLIIRSYYDKKSI